MGLHTSTRTVSDVITEIKRTFGDESAVQVTDGDIIRWINSAQREILVTNPVLKAVGTTDIVAGVSEYPLTDLNIISIQAIHYLGRKVEFKTFQEAEEYITESDPTRTFQGDPFIWYEWGGMINLYPVPQQDYPEALRIYYVPEPAVAVDGGNLALPDAYYENIVQYVLARAYELDEDNENSQFKLSQFENRLNSLSEQSSSPSENTYPRITILEEDL